VRRVPSVAVAVLAEDGRWRLPAPPLRDAVHMGHGNFEFDSDGILRRFSATKQSGDRALTALAIEAASLAKPMPVPVGRSIAPAFRIPPRAIPQVSAVDLLMWDGFSTRPPPEGRPRRGRGRVENPSHIVLSGQIVFIGL